MRNFKLKTATALLLSLALACTALDAAASNPARTTSRGHTVMLGVIHVTLADSEDARAAALAAKRSGAVFLGTVSVTPEDSEDARYASAEAGRTGAVYLGSVTVKPEGFAARFVAGLHAVRAFVVACAVAGTLAFARVWG